MEKYKVKVIGHQLKGKVVAKAGDIVEESQLMSEASELVKAGFIEKLDEKPKLKSTRAIAKTKEIDK